MLKILHKAIQNSVDLDTTQLTGNLAADTTSAYIQSLKAGVYVKYNAAGGIEPADGAVDADNILGPLINDADGYFYENKPALASNKAAVVYGGSVLSNDRIAANITIAKGDLLYIGTGADVGKLTNVASATKFVVGTALSAAGPASPFVTYNSKY